MFGVKIVLSFAVIALSGLAGKTNCQLPACPVCDYQFNQTYLVGSLYNINNGGPPMGCTCAQGVVYTLFGRDFGVTKDASCCDLSPPPRTPNSGLTCPPILRIRPSETVAQNFVRVGQTITNAPTNGNCPDPNTYQFIFYRELTGAAQDICTCVTINNYVQKKEFCFNGNSITVED